MISIGNDIVALDYINSRRTLEKKFYSKILCDDEISLFNNNDFQLSFENFIWLCWSIKESVYKFVKRHCHQAVFSPTKIPIKTIIEPQQQIRINSKINEGISFNKAECFCCKVLYNNHTYYTRSILNKSLIFTVANHADCFENISWGIKDIDNDSHNFQTQSVRTFVLERLKQQFKTEHLQIEKAEAGFPYIIPYHNLPLSFTHHGNFVGYSFVLEDKSN